MKVSCPKCDSEIAAVDVNMTAGALFCRRCEEMFPLPVRADNLSRPLPQDFDIGTPPGGAWHEQTLDGDKLGATCRGAFGALFSLVFSVMFGGIPLLIITGQLSAKAEDKAPIEFLSIFVFIGFVAAIVFVLKVFGKTQVTLTGSELHVHTGVLGLGWTRQQELAGLESMQQRECGKTNNRSTYHLVLEWADGRTLKFGMLLSQKRLDYMENALRYLLRERAAVQV